MVWVLLAFASSANLLFVLRLLCFGYENTTVISSAEATVALSFAHSYSDEAASSADPHLQKHFVRFFQNTLTLFQNAL